MTFRAAPAFAALVLLLALFLGTALAYPKYALAATFEESIAEATYQSSSLQVEQNEPPLKVGIFFPKDGVASAYQASLRTALRTIRQQIEGNQSLPQIEFIEAELVNSEALNSEAIDTLIQQGVDAIIAPNFLSALITASSNEFDITPLVSRTGKTHELVLAGESSPYGNLSEHSIIVRTIQKLKFRGRLEQVLLMYNPADIFGQFGYRTVVDVLSKENASFSTEIFSAGNVDFLAKLDALKKTNPHTTVIIIGSTADVADVIVQAQDEVGLSGNVLGFTGDGNPAVYDLADRRGNRGISGVAWDISPRQTLSEMVVRQFNNDRFAAEAYIAIWTILRSIDETHPSSRAGIRNAFIEHQGNNLEEPSAHLAALMYGATSRSIAQAVNNLASAQISQLSIPVSADSNNLAEPSTRPEEATANLEESVADSEEASAVPEETAADSEEMPAVPEETVADQEEASASPEGASPELAAEFYQAIRKSITTVANRLASARLRQFRMAVLDGSRNPEEASTLTEEVTTDLEESAEEQEESNSSPEETTTEQEDTATNHLETPSSQEETDSGVAETTTIQEGPSAALAAEFYHTLRQSLAGIVNRLTPAQIGQFYRPVSPDLQ